VTTAAKAEDSFPPTAARADILHWLASNSDLNANSVVAMTDEGVVAIADRQDGRGLDGSARLTLREEVINADAAATWGGRSVQLDLDLDCLRHRVMLGVRRVYAQPNLQGSAVVSRSDTTWTEAPPGTVIEEVVRAVCSPQPPAQLAVAQPEPAAPPVQAAAAEPPPAEEKPPADTAAPPSPAPVRTAAAEPAAPPPEQAPAPDTPPGAPAPAGPVEVAAADPPAAPATASAAPIDRSVMVHNPFVAPVAQTSGAQTSGAQTSSAKPAGPTARPAARAATAAVPAPRLPDFAVQIDTVASANLAMDSWQSLKARLPDLVAPHTFAVEPVSDKGRTLYRALLLGFASPDEAADLCKALRARSVDCTLRQMR
jgi:hypothetical protein